MKRITDVFKRIHILRGLAVISLSLLVSISLVQAEDKKTSLEEIVVTDTAPVVDPNLSATSEQVTAEDLKNRNVPNAEDAIKYMPNLRVRKRFIGDRNAVMEVRGMSNIQSARGLVMTDGIMLSNFLSSQHETAPRWSMVSPEEIDRVDVIYGPFSALYSGNAMGAAVIYTTRMPERFEASASLLGHQQRFSLYGTDDAYNGYLANIFVGDRKGRLSYMLAVSHLEATGQPTSFVTLTPSTTALQGGETAISSGTYFVENRNGDDRVLIGLGGSGIEENKQNELKLKLAYDFTHTLHGRLLLGYWTMDRDSGREGDTTYLRDSSGNPVYSGAVNIGGFRYTVPTTSFSPRAGEETHWISGLSLKTTHPQGWNYEAVASLYRMAENLTRTATSAPPAAMSGGTGTLNDWDGSGWRTMDFKVDRKPYDGERHWVTFGAHQDTYEMDQKDYATTNWKTGGPSSTNAIFLGKTQTQALFAQDSWRFAEAWRTVLGMRYEVWRALDGSRTNATPTTVTYPDRRETALSPKASLEYTPNSRWLYRVSLAQATRFPTVTELFQGSISGNQIVNSDPNLKPEKAFSKDFSIERTLENGIMRVSFWEEDTTDTLFRQANTVVVPSITNYQNIDRVRIRGIEWSYDAANVLLPGLEMSASLARNFSEIIENSTNPATEGNEFYRIPRWRASIVGTYHQNEKLAYTLAGRYSGKQFGSLENTDVNPDAFDGVSSYTVFDAKVVYGLNKYANLGLGVDNLTDERYFVGHPYSGRTMFAEVKVKY